MANQKLTKVTEYIFSVHWPIIYDIVFLGISLIYKINRYKSIMYLHINILKGEGESEKKIFSS